MSDPFVGQIMQVGFNFAPVNWAPCNGALISISQNAALFALLGTTFGGNGQTNFGLPDFQGRVSIGIGNGAGLSPYVWGERGGMETVTLNVSQLPAHTHAGTVSNLAGTIKASTAGGTNPTPLANDYLGGGTKIYTPTGTTTVNLSGLSITGGTVTNSLTGSNLPIPNVQPFLAVQTNIAMFGIFPSRS